MTYVKRSVEIHGLLAEFIGMQSGLEFYRVGHGDTVKLYGVQHNNQGDFIKVSLTVTSRLQVSLVDLGD